MSEIPKRNEYFLSPDGVRKLTQFMKSHFDSYPSKDKLYTDSKGLQYNGSVYNFGSEILLETNKLKMTKPPVRNLTYGKDTTFYFDIQYSSLIDTYEQQNLLMCVLKKDTLVASHQYQLVFNNVTEHFVIRSTNTSAGNTVTPSMANSKVFKDKFYVTDEFPIMVESYEEGGETVTIQHEIRIKDGNKFPKFYFHYNSLTMGYVEIVDGTLRTAYLTDDMNGLPFIWFTTKSFEYLPVISLSDNIDAEGRPFLTFGTGGNGVSKIFPNCYENNFPPYIPLENHEWFLKVESNNDFSFISDDTPGDKSRNFQIPIKSISLLYSYRITDRPDIEIVFDFSDIPDVVVYLDDCKNYIERSSWRFNKRTSSDWDWDPITYNNPNYAWHYYEFPTEPGYYNISDFSCNHMDGRPLRAGFRIKFLNEYLYRWESDLVGDVSGVHVDSTDERSNNAVIERNGVSHLMGEFDGLPVYMKMQLDENIHRSHVELYSIRDHNNKYTQLPMDKQTAGLIIDSSVPQNQLPSFIGGNSNIVYDILVSNLYKTVGEIVSMKNVLSDIVYVDNKPNTFGDKTVRVLANYPQFIYHGNNFFSTDVVALDPYSEYGRVYVVSNDSAKYENNSTTDNPKPLRTIARICDIPTSMVQLTDVPDYAPEVLIDWNDSDLNYVRTYCNYSTEDKNKVLNSNDNWIKNGDDVVFPNDYDLSIVLTDDYKIIENINVPININFNNNDTITITNGGSGYNDTGTAKFNIGGRYFEIEYTAVGGVVQTIAPTETLYSSINPANLEGADTVFHTTDMSGTGTGLNIKIHIDNWAGKTQHVTNEYRHGLYLFKFDEYNHVWIWIYDGTEWKQHIQFTGTNVTPNPYDLVDTDKRRLNDVYLCNALNANRKLYYETFSSKPGSVYGIDLASTGTIVPKSEIGMDDISDWLSTIRQNVQNTFYMFKPDPDSNFSILDSGNRYSYDVQNHRVGNYHDLKLPRYNTLNLRTYFNIERISYSINKDKLKSQPDVYWYNPIGTNVNTLTNVSGDVYTVNETHKLSLADLVPTWMNKQSNLYIIKENIYRYDETENPEYYDEMLEKFESMTRDQLIAYIIETFGSNALPLMYETSIIKYTIPMLIDYCMMITWNAKKNEPSMFAQKYQNVAQEIENDDGTKTLTPVNGYECKGMVESLSADIHPLDYELESSTAEIAPNILFIFNIQRQSSLISLRHFHMLDENGVDISEHSLLIYDGHKYLFNSSTDNWDII